MGFKPLYTFTIGYTGMWTVSLITNTLRLQHEQFLGRIITAINHIRENNTNDPTVTFNYSILMGLPAKSRSQVKLFESSFDALSASLQVQNANSEDKIYFLVRAMMGKAPPKSTGARIIYGLNLDSIGIMGVQLATEFHANDPNVILGFPRDIINSWKTHDMANVYTAFGVKTLQTFTTKNNVHILEMLNLAREDQRLWGEKFLHCRGYYPVTCQGLNAEDRKIRNLNVQLPPPAVLDGATAGGEPTAVKSGRGQPGSSSPAITPTGSNGGPTSRDAKSECSEWGTSTTPGSYGRTSAKSKHGPTIGPRPRSTPESSSRPRSGREYPNTKSRYESGFDAKSRHESGSTWKWNRPRSDAKHESGATRKSTVSKPRNGPGLQSLTRYESGLQPESNVRPRLQPQPRYGPGQQPKPRYGPGQQPKPRYGPGPQPKPRNGPGLQPESQYGPRPQPKPRYGPGLQPKSRNGPGLEPKPRYEPGLQPESRCEVEVILSRGGINDPNAVPSVDNVQALFDYYFEHLPSAFEDLMVEFHAAPLRKLATSILKPVVFLENSIDFGIDSVKDAILTLALEAYIHNFFNGTPIRVLYPALKLVTKPGSNNRLLRAANFSFLEPLDASTTPVPEDEDTLKELLTALSTARWGEILHPLFPWYKLLHLDGASTERQRELAKLIMLGAISAVCDTTIQFHLQQAQIERYGELSRREVYDLLVTKPKPLCQAKRHTLHAFAKKLDSIHIKVEEGRDVTL
ncbi:unnamed protein product [Owenia fusiformis]|uniref:Uncharacterized protein n=1 Tax=Owenia fusiformis TaxID=6347 RepID=A0A8S4PJK6_OWEFU|nr:unnamed protein product [Owenia fusiformis]